MCLNAIILQRTAQKERSTKDAKWKKSKGSKQKQLREMLFMLPITDNAQDQMKADTRERNILFTFDHTRDRTEMGLKNRTSLPAIAWHYTHIGRVLCLA